MFLYKIKWFICLLCFYTIGYSGKDLSAEHWITTDDLYNVTINMTAENIKNTLGEPLFIESSFDVDDGVAATGLVLNLCVATRYSYSKRSIDLTLPTPSVKKDSGNLLSSFPAK